MKCANPACGQDLEPGERFCGYCGTDAPTGVQETRPMSPGPPTLTGTYSAQISRQNPSCLIFLIDQSGSMEAQLLAVRGKRKSK